MSITVLPKEVIIDKNLPLMWNLAPLVLRNQSRSVTENSGYNNLGDMDISLIRAGYSFAKNKKEFLKQVIAQDEELQKILPIKFNIAGLEQILGVHKVRPTSNDPKGRWYEEALFFPGSEIKTKDWDLILESNKEIKGGYVRYGEFSNWMQAKDTGRSRMRFWISPRIRNGKNLEFNLADMTAYFSYEDFNAGVIESFMIGMPIHYFGDLKSLGAGISGLSNDYIKMYAKKQRYKEKGITIKYTDNYDKKNVLEFEGDELSSISKAEFDRVVGQEADLTKNNILMGRMFSQYSKEKSEIDFDVLFKDLFNIYRNKEFDKLKGLDFIPFKQPYQKPVETMSMFLSGLDGHGPEHYPYGFNGLGFD